MVAAQALLVSNMSAAAAARSIGVSQPLMAQAVIVRDYASDQVAAVIAGPKAPSGTTLDKAYEIAKDRKAGATCPATS